MRQIFRDLVLRSSATVANRVLDRVEQRCATIQQFPKRGIRYDRQNLDHLRRVFEPPYVIVYEEFEDEVIIVAVLHENRNIEDELSRAPKSAS